MSHKSCCACCAALGHVVEVLDALANRECSGHEGDEETGEHYEDCMRCRVDAALAHAEEVAATRYVAPQNHHSFALESLKRDNQSLAADYDGALARAQKNARILCGIADWIDEHPEDPMPPSVLLHEAREAAIYAGIGRGRDRLRDGEGGEEARGIPENPTKSPLDSPRGVAGDRCEVGNECGRLGCPECQQ